MIRRIYIDWRPVGAAPVMSPETTNIDWFGDERLRNDLLLKAIGSDTLLEIEKDLQKVCGVECVARNDGVFVFIITLESELDIAQSRFLVRLIASAIKSYLGHIHDFHHPLGGKNTKSWIPGYKPRNVLDPDTILNIDPVELKVVIPNNNKNNEFLRKFAENEQELLSTVEHSSQGHRERPALIRLRRIFLSKHEMCVKLIKLNEIESKNIINDFFQMTFCWIFMILTALFVAKYNVNGYFENFPKYFGMTFFMSLASSQVLYIYRYINEHRLPIIRLLRQLKGFIAYGSIFSEIIDAMCRKHKKRGKRISRNLILLMHCCR